MASRGRCYKHSDETKHTKVFQRTLLLVALGRLAVHEVVKADRVLEEVVDTVRHLLER